MKHKAMLLKALSQSSNDTKKAIIKEVSYNKSDDIIGTMIIAVSGAKRGIGCTHTAIAIANYIARTGNSVALVEMNENKHFSYIYNENYDSGKLQNSFCIDGVDYYINNTYKYADILGAGYKYIVLDLSVIKPEDSSYIEMQRANRQVLVCGINEWELQSILDTLKDNKSWFLYVNFADKDMFKSFKNNLDRDRVYMLPFCPDIYKFYDEQDEVLKYLNIF